MIKNPVLGGFNLIRQSVGGALTIILPFRHSNGFPVFRSIIPPI